MSDGVSLAQKSLEIGSQGEAQVMKSARAAGLVSLRWSVQSGLAAKLRLSHRTKMDQGKTRTGVGRLFTELYARTNVQRKRSIVSIAARPSGIREQDDLHAAAAHLIWAGASSGLLRLTGRSFQD